MFVYNFALVFKANDRHQLKQFAIMSFLIYVKAAECQLGWPYVLFAICIFLILVFSCFGLGFCFWVFLFPVVAYVKSYSTLQR